jgi:hypothetical protein
MPILRGEEPAERGIGWMYYSPMPTAENGYAFRYGKYKYVVGGISCNAAQATFNCTKPQLYDVSTDYAEDHDLAASRPDVLGENNHPAFSAEALGCPLLALFDEIVRDLEGDSLSALVDRVLEDARASSDAEMVKDIFVMAFQTRWCRGGKAEKLLFYKFIVHLYERFPNVASPT